ncbi:MAG: dihydropteroate synthase [Xanthobacteraceae bacterium]
MYPELRKRGTRRDAFLHKLGLGPVVMGILNVTPDSFFDGGRLQDVEAAVAHARKLIAEGCGIVDIGGESARPGAVPITAADELARVEPVLSSLARIDAPVSIDTSKAEVAARALELGAIAVNDVGGLQKDARMADVVAAAEAIVVIMHNRADKDEAIDIVAELRRFFDASLRLANRAGIPRDRIILDPGIGFGKTSRQNRDAIARLPELKDYGLPILVGASRKAFLGSLMDDRAEASLSGTIAANLAAAAAGATIFRVHEVAEHVAALKVFHAIRQGQT